MRSADSIEVHAEPETSFSPGGDQTVSLTFAQVEQLEAQIRQAETRALNAEAELERVRDAVAKAASQAKEARAQRRMLLEQAQTLAQEIVRQARVEAGAVEAGEPDDGTSTMISWAAVDPTLDARVDTFLSNSMEPDSTRGWMLNET